MSSQPSLLRDVRRLINSKLLRVIPQRLARPFAFGMQAYALRPFQSATGNARSVIASPNAAARRAERLLANRYLASYLGKVFDTLGLVTPQSFVNVDHSDMHGIIALVGAVQTRLGRAIPCMVEATFAPNIPSYGSVGSTLRTIRLRTEMLEARRVQSLTGHTIDSLQDFHDRLGFWPKLVFDRGFGNESIIRHLSAEGATFYIRLKAARYVELDGQRLQVQQLRAVDATVQLYGYALRIIRSAKDTRCKEPWYILTNDLTTSRKKVLEVYYHRFEIEEVFRDIKHVWELKRTRFNRPNSVKVVLWFVVLGIAAFYVLTRPDKLAGLAMHPKKRISWVRAAQEAYQRELTRVSWLYG